MAAQKVREIPEDENKRGSCSFPDIAIEKEQKECSRMQQQHRTGGMARLETEKRVKMVVIAYAGAVYEPMAEEMPPTLMHSDERSTRATTMTGK